MNISFDEEADALYIRFQEGSVEKTIKVQDGILIDIDNAGRIFGIEILDVSQRIPKNTIGKVSIDFPVKTKLAQT